MFVLYDRKLYTWYMFLFLSPPVSTCLHAPPSHPLLLSLLVCTQSGSWCPKFVSRRGVRHRESLFRVGSTSRSRSPGNGGRGGSDGFGAPSILGGGASVSGEEDRGRGHLDDGGRGRRMSSSVPGLCEAEIRGDNWLGSHEVGRTCFFLLLLVLPWLVGAEFWVWFTSGLAYFQRLTSACFFS